MATSAKGTRETSPLLPNGRDHEAQIKPDEDKQTSPLPWPLVAGIGFMWIASFLAATGQLLASHGHLPGL